jgi:hypothetical protein
MSYLYSRDFSLLLADIVLATHMSDNQKAWYLGWLADQLADRGDTETGKAIRAKIPTSE